MQQSHKVDLPPSADEMGRGRTYSIRPVTQSSSQPLHTEQNLDNVYKAVMSQIISEKYMKYKIKFKNSFKNLWIQIVIPRSQ
jgi:hypothetical protein